MSPEFIVALGTSVGTVLTSVALLITALRRAATKLEAQTDVRATALAEETVVSAKALAKQTKTAAGVAEGKLDEIHGLVNGRLDEALAEIRRLQEQLKKERSR